MIAFGIIILRYAIAKKRYFKPIVKYIFIVYSIIAITLGVLTLLCQTYEGYGTICLGIACFRLSGYEGASSFKMDYRIPVAIRWIFCRNWLYTLWYWIIEVN